MGSGGERKAESKRRLAGYREQASLARLYGDATDVKRNSPFLSAHQPPILAYLFFSNVDPSVCGSV